MFIEDEPRNIIQAPLGAACSELNGWPQRCLWRSSPCRSCRSLDGARAVCAIDMALLAELCPRPAPNSIENSEWRNTLNTNDLHRFLPIGRPFSCIWYISWFQLPLPAPVALP